MGGVDLYDQHCSDVNIKIKSKKWTFLFFLRLIESALSNSTVLHNSCTTKKNKSTYEFATTVAEHYLRVQELENFEKHNIITSPYRRVCSTCNKRIYIYSFECRKQYCEECFHELHKKTHVEHKAENQIRKNECGNNLCKKRTLKYCLECKEYMCKTCFEGKYHDEESKKN